MIIKHETWPELGRMGLCRSREYKDVYVLVYTDPVPHWWAVMLDVPDDRGSAMYLEGDEEMRRIAEQLDIAWLPDGGEEVELERAVFDLRSTLLSREQIARRLRRDERLRRFMPWARKAPVGGDHPDRGSGRVQGR